MATTKTPKMLSIRIDYEVGRQLKALCALKGQTVREVMTDFARLYVTHADGMPSQSAPSVQLAALTQLVANDEAKTYAEKRNTRKPKAG